MITLEISFGAFVGLGVFAGIVVLGVAGGLTIRNKLRNVSRQLFGTESIVDGLNRQADIAAETPKSVSGMTRLMEPQIMRDFPDFNWSEFKHRAENMLTSALLGATGGCFGGSKKSGVKYNSGQSGRAGKGSIQ